MSKNKKIFYGVMILLILILCVFGVITYKQYRQTCQGLQCITVVSTIDEALNLINNQYPDLVKARGEINPNTIPAENIKTKNFGWEIRVYWGLCPECYCLFDISKSGTITKLPKGMCPYEQQQTTTTVEKQITITTDKTEYEQGETVKITVRNINEKENCVSGFDVERFKKGRWVKVKRVWCPCGAICNIQPCEPLQQNEQIEYKWGQEESWCSGPQGRSETIHKQVPIGVYRIKMQTVGEDIYSNEFTIK